jgi:hypothetical protein
MIAETDSRRGTRIEAGLARHDAENTERTSNDVGLNFTVPLGYGRLSSRIAAMCPRPRFSTALFLLFFAWTAPVLAGEIDVQADATARTAKVVAKDAELDAVLGKLGAALGFEISRSGNNAPAGTISGRFEGSIDIVLSRLLRGEGHMIQRSDEAKAGIVRVVLFGSTNPTAGGTAIAARRTGRHRPTNSDEEDHDEEQARAEEEAMQQAEQQRQRAAKLRSMQMRRQVHPGAAHNRARAEALRQRHRPRP